MKTIPAIKVGFSLLLLLVIILIPQNNFANTTDVISPQLDDVIITIDNKTTDTNLKEIKAMLEEHGITATFSKIRRNESGELTSIRIALEDGTGSQTISEFSSSQPISKLTFGLKDGSLFINQGDKPNDMMSAFNFPNITLGFPADSLFGQNFKGFNFQDFFGNSNDSLFLKEQADIQKLMERMRQGLQDNNSNQQGKYQFLDNPNLDKLIIIDGEENDFETLNRLAKADKLADVEVLNSKIAVSIYGDKAKDGAIVAVTKK